MLGCFQTLPLQQIIAHREIGNDGIKPAVAAKGLFRRSVDSTVTDRVQRRIGTHPALAMTVIANQRPVVGNRHRTDRVAMRAHRRRPTASDTLNAAKEEGAATLTIKGSHRIGAVGWIDEGT